MKTFRRLDGTVAGKTMTVSELRTLLYKYSDDMPVFAEWEGYEAYVEPEMFRLQIVRKGMSKDACLCLVVDVNAT